MKYYSKRKALILLADGTIFYGKSVGSKEGTAVGEVCFNTGMTGYQEIFTDPSYFGQLMVTTNAHIGNYGTQKDEIESDAIKISGLICKTSVTNIRDQARTIACWSSWKTINFLPFQMWILGHWLPIFETMGP